MPDAGTINSRKIVGHVLWRQDLPGPWGICSGPMSTACRPGFQRPQKSPPRNGEGLGIQIIRYLLFFDRGLFYNSAVLVSAAKVLVFCKNSAHRDNVTHIGHFL